MEKLCKIVQDARQNLEEKLSTITHTFVTEEEFDEGEDFMYEGPRVSRVDKYSMYGEYLVMSIKDGKIIGRGITEGWEDDFEFELSYLTTDELASVAWEYQDKIK